MSCIVACIVHPCQARVGGMQVPHHTAACRGRGSSHRTAKLYADENLAHTNTRQACVGTVRHTDTRTGAVGRSTTLRRDRNRNHCRDIIIEMLSCRLADGRSHLPKREARRRDPTCEESTCEESEWWAPTAARVLTGGARAGAPTAPRGASTAERPPVKSPPVKSPPVKSRSGASTAERPLR